MKARGRPIAPITHTSTLIISAPTLIFSTNDNDPKFATYDLGVGYRLYQAENCKDGWLSYVIPTAELHANLPVSKEGFANRIDFALPDSLIATAGVHVGLGCKANLLI